MLSIVICVIAVLLTFIIACKRDETHNIYSASQITFIAAFLSVVCWIILDFIIGAIVPVEYTYSEKLYYEDIIVNSDKIVYTDEEDYVCEITTNKLDSIQLQEDTENYIEVKYYEHNPKWLAITGGYQEYIVHGNAELKEGPKWELRR
jgi:hypothetical protein